MKQDNEMREKAEDAILSVLGLLAVGMAGIALVLMLSGCAGAKPVVMERAVHDTVRTVTRDTVWQDRFVERIVERVKKEATSVKDSTVKTVDAKGNVIKEEHWRGEKTRESSEGTERLRDSATMWKARYEAVLRTRADSARVDKVHGNERTWRETMDDALRSLGLMALGMAAVLFVVWLKKK